MAEAICHLVKFGRFVFRAILLKRPSARQREYRADLDKTLFKWRQSLDRLRHLNAVASSLPRADIAERARATADTPATDIAGRAQVISVAVGVDADGRREVLGMDVGPSEAETFWTEFLRKLPRRGLRGVKLMISHAREG